MEFIDAEEFLVIQDGCSVTDFLTGYARVRTVALHWYFFGSNGHERHPDDWVIRAYMRRATEANYHFMVFVRPDKVTRNCNSHNFYYRNAQCAVNIDGQRVFASTASPPDDQPAWIKHYFCKSLEDYVEKAALRSTLDKSGTREASRRLTSALEAFTVGIDVVDDSAVSYLEKRCAIPTSDELSISER